MNRDLNRWPLAASILRKKPVHLVMHGPLESSLSSLVPFPHGRSVPALFLTSIIIIPSHKLTLATLCSANSVPLYKQHTQRADYREQALHSVALYDESLTPAARCRSVLVPCAALRFATAPDTAVYTSCNTHHSRKQTNKTPRSFHFRNHCASSSIITFDTLSRRATTR